MEGLLVLADGTVLRGQGFGAKGTAIGEVVFNTGMSGYQEVITDPSYAGQIITFTYPHIGNYGVNATDDEAAKPFCRGVIIRDLARRQSNWRSEEHLDDYLRRHGLAGIAGIDTRRLTRHLRDTGAMPGAFGPADHATLLAAAKAEPGATRTTTVPAGEGAFSVCQLPTVTAAPAETAPPPMAAPPLPPSAPPPTAPPAPARPLASSASLRARVPPPARPAALPGC